MAGSIYQLPTIHADTNAGTGAMSGASQSFSHAGTVFGALRKSILDEEQRKIENDYKERQFAEAIRQFGLTDARANRIAAETERHNKATEEYQLKNLAETARYHTASLANQKAYHDALIGARNERTKLQYGGRAFDRDAFKNALFGDETPAAAPNTKAVPANSGYTELERALASGMTGDQLADLANESMIKPTLGSTNQLGGTLLGAGTYFGGMPLGDMSMGDAATIGGMSLEDRLAQQQEQEMRMAREVSTFWGQGNPIEASSPTSTPVPTPNPVQPSEREFSLNPFAATPVHAATLPPQQAPVVYKVSPIGAPTTKDLEISASAFKPMDLADIDRRNAPLPINERIRAALTNARLAESPTQQATPAWYDAGGSQLRDTITMRNALVEQKAKADGKTPEQLVSRIAGGGRKEARMVGNSLLWETPMQRKRRELAEAESRAKDNPNVAFNLNRYDYNNITENEEYALQQFDPSLRNEAKTYIADFFGAQYNTPMGNGSENANRSSIIASKELEQLNAIATLGDMGKDYAIAQMKRIIHAHPEFAAKGKRAIAYLSDFYDKRFMTSEGRAALDANYMAQSGSKEYYKIRDDYYKDMYSKGEAQRNKNDKVNRLLSNPEMYSRTFNNLSPDEQNSLSRIVGNYMATTDFKSADDQARHALAFIQTLNQMPIGRKFLREDKFLNLSGNLFSNVLHLSDADNLSITDNSKFATAFRRNLRALEREGLTGKSMENRLLSVFNDDNKK